MNNLELKKENFDNKINFNNNEKEKNSNQQLYNGIWKVQFENKETTKIKVNKKR